MNRTLTSDEVLEGLRQTGLLSSEELERAVTANPTSLSTGRNFASSLVSIGALTPYQMEVICDGRLAELKVGNYEVLDRLGAGGMGTVYKARHKRMKRIVALKVLPTKLAQDRTFVQRFQREVETIARLNHPNIVMAFDADEDEKIGHFLVMEYVEGSDLATLVQREGSFTVPRAVNCILQAARGLEYAHSQRIIHRDIKPANLMLDAQEVVKVTDLGLARFNSLCAGDPGETAAASGITQAGGIIGTVDFMPPEQAFESTSVDHRADIYSLGATLYFLLFGRPAYQGETIMATLLKHREAPVPLLSAVRSDIPSDLNDSFRRMLAKAPVDRFQTMTEVVRAFEVIDRTISGSRTVTLASRDAGRDVTIAAGSIAELETGASSGPQSATASAAPTAAIPSAMPRTVLLVEPSRTLSSIFRKSLESHGVEIVLAVATGHAAIEAATTEAPGVIISALHLADMTGLELVQHIRNENIAVTSGFVLISSEAENQEAVTLSRLGGALLLRKPFTTETLVQAVRTVAKRNVVGTPRTDLSTIRVLVVDDSAPSRSHIRNVLFERGLSAVTEACDGAQAVAALASGKFDLIVTDYNMPYMDGLGLMGYLKQNAATSAIPVIMVTSEHEQSKLAAVRQLGVAAICDKSFPVEVVDQVLARHVRSS